jgi:hypothetical protein
VPAGMPVSLSVLDDGQLFGSNSKLGGILVLVLSVLKCSSGLYCKSAQRSTDSDRITW